MVLMPQARDHILLSEIFSTVNSTLGFKTPIPDHLQETLQAYGAGLGILAWLPRPTSSISSASGPRQPDPWSLI